MRLALLFLIAAAPCIAQYETADVLGTVKDARSSVVPKATVTLINQETGIEAKTTSDEQGDYLFSQVKVGKYTVTAEAAGFSKAVAADIAVDVNARQRVDLTLQVGAVTETVNVVGAAAALETDSSEHGQVVNTQQVVELPLNGRNYADLALLATNTVKSPMAVSFSPSGTPREAAFNVNGMRSTYNNFLLDGVDNNAYGTSNQSYSAQVISPSPDAIAEFKVITSNYSAEYGRVGGAVVNAVTKSGTNQFHGAAWEFLRNTALNAVGFQFSPSVFLKPTLQRNQFGAALGGPFIKNKLFWFGDYEGYRQLQRYLNFDSIPTTTDRAGILPVTVVDPLTQVVYPAGTQIPIQKLNPFASYALSNLPPTNAGGASRSNNDEALLLGITAISTTPRSTTNSTRRCRYSCAGASARTCNITRRILLDLPAAMATGISTQFSRTRRSDIRGRCRQPRFSRRASGGRMFWPGRNRRTSAAPAWNRCSASRGCRPRRI
jgi:hypothetical protein